MQCVNCTFHNMPGAAACGRCGSSLVLSNAIEIHPPRASVQSKRVRKLFPSWFRRDWFTTVQRSNVATRGLGSVIGRGLSVQWPRPGVWLRFVVPGWAQFASGAANRGRLFLGGFAFLFLAAIFFYASTLGNVLMGLAFSVHVSSILDALGGHGNVRQRIHQVALFMAAVGVLVYWPMGYLANAALSPRQLNQDMGEFRRGDVLLVNRWVRPRSGQTVLWWMARDIQQSNPYSQTGFLHMVYWQRAGERVARVVAGPGQTVEWDGSELRIDGDLVDLKRNHLEADRLPKESPFYVSPGYYLIQPVGVPVIDQVNDASTWRATSITREEYIRGRIFMVYEPLRRRSWVR